MNSLISLVQDLFFALVGNICHGMKHGVIFRDILCRCVGLGLGLVFCSFDVLIFLACRYGRINGFRCYICHEMRRIDFLGALNGGSAVMGRRC